ncbi:hypothetical protein [Spirosoma areae]
MRKESVVCTLFEGHYHYGVAALVNSLYQQGFRGDIYAGYRGELPNWIKNAKANKSLNWPDATTAILAEDLQLHFLPVVNDYHFTNYKPNFILNVWNGPAKDAEGIFYFDPDIINKCSWSFYERWITYGVAIVREIVWNDMPPSHPKRQQWAEVAKSGNLFIKNDLNSYLNAGFIGVNKSQVSFLNMWVNLMDLAVENFGYDKSSFAQSIYNNDLFTVGDQDLLNLTAMCTDQPISEMGPEGMDFTYGGWTMSHATGSPKPWKKKFINSFLKGIPPSKADKLYWDNVHGIIRLYTENEIYIKRLQLNFSAFLGRFYHRI